MIANYHTHTWRCKHARDTEREYVERAVEAGLQILGFSDHTPMPYEGDYVSTTKMDMNQLEDYVDTVLSLRDEYRRDIEIHLGLEVEYYPKYWDALLDVTETYPIEYFLLGQHFIRNEIGEPFCGIPTESEPDLKQYCDQTIAAMETGLFTYFAHPDVFHFVGNAAAYEKEMRRICVRAKELGIPLEINLLGLGTGRHYPNEQFWKMAGEIGNKVILGSDAHDAKNVVNEKVISAGSELAAKYGLTVLETVEFRSPVRR